MELQGRKARSVSGRRRCAVRPIIFVGTVYFTNSISLGRQVLSKNDGSGL